MFQKKTLLKILLSILILITISLFLIFSESSQSSFAYKVKQKIPTPIKDTLKNTVFFIPIKIRTYNEIIESVGGLKLDINKLKKENDVLKSELKRGMVSNFILEDDKNENLYSLKKIYLPYGNVIKNEILELNDYKKKAYIENYKDKIIIIYWSGKSLFINKSDLNNAYVEIHERKTNINKFINNEYSNSGIKDLLIINDTIYASYTKEILVEDKIYPDKKFICLNTSILSATLNDKFDIPLNFNEFFTYKDCAVVKFDKQARYGAAQAGGRMQYHDRNNKIYLTIGDFMSFVTSQNPESNLGKIISINMENKKSKILSLGHRNQQGLLLIKNENLLIASEHGQRAGDEVNVIHIEKKDQNYGWPIASYSTYYGFENFEIRKLAPFYKSHKERGFIEPAIQFSPSIAPSEIVFNIFENLDNKRIILSTLKDKSLHFLEITDDFTIIKSTNRLFIGEGIRDIIPLKDHYVLFLQDSPALGILKKK
jgi:hypothetical protein